MAGAAALAVIGATVVTPWVLLWAVIGIFLATGYALERPSLVHTDLGFALAWGAFPALVGYWAQTEAITVGALAVGGFATLTSLAQRSLSTPARYVRRKVDRAETHLYRDLSTEHWDEQQLLATWERPLRLLTWAMVTLAVALLAVRAAF
jgi:hypothetical protein